MTDIAQRIALQFEIEQFYYAEAQMLDDRRFLAWLDLLSPDIAYTIPLRSVPQANAKARNTDEFHALANELSKGCEPPFREDTHMTLSIRAKRAVYPQSWSENPPARTRRLITNVVIAGDMAGEGGDELAVTSNFMIDYSRHSADNHIYIGQRQDRLRRVDSTWQIAARRIILDWNVVTGPSLGLFF